MTGLPAGLSEIAADEIEPARVNLDGRIGDLSLPVQGLVLRPAGEADAAGVTRPGIIVATRPRAMVDQSDRRDDPLYWAPCSIYGNVIILEPQAGTLFVLAGLEVVYGQAGQVIARGTPVGLMGGQ